MSAPVAITCPIGSVASWTRGKAKTPRRAPHLNESTSEVARQSARHTAAAQGDSASAAADEGHHRLAAAEPGEEGERVPDHRAGDAGEAAPPARERQAGDAREQPLGGVAEERGQRAAPAELLERVPGAGVAVAGRAQVDAVAARDEQRHRDRAQQIAQHGCYDVSHRCPWPPSI